MIVQAYVEHVRATKTAKSAQTDIYYLREAFGPICEGVRITSRKPSEAARKRAIVEPKNRKRVAPIEANHFEDSPPSRTHAAPVGRTATRSSDEANGDDSAARRRQETVDTLIARRRQRL